MDIQGLVELYRMFDIDHLDKMVITKKPNDTHQIEFFDRRGKMKFSGTVSWVSGIPQYKVSYSDYPEGYWLGFRKSFVPSQLDEKHIAEYWERRSKGKGGKSKKGGKTTLGKLSRMSKEVVDKHVKAGKSLLATLTE